MVRLGWVRLQMVRLGFTLVWFGLILFRLFTCLKKGGGDTSVKKTVVEEIYLTLPMCHVLVDVGDHGTPFSPVMRHLHQVP